nr:retrotransposon protein, putative, Ty1-copia subclass [Tanacetum cinerariifolium]
MKPQHLFGDSSAVHECTRMVKERLRQAFRATMLVDDTRNESSRAKTHVLNVEEVKRPNRVLNTEDLIRTIILKFGKAYVLVNGSPTSEFQFHCGLKQGLKLNNSVTISHLFYADDAVFVGDRSSSNLACIMNVLQCFSLTSGIKINVHKSHLLGVGVLDSIIVDAATSLGCSIMKTPFTYLGVPVGSNMTNIKAWDDIIRKIKSRLSKWKVKTLSVGGRLTLLKSVLGATPIYWMSIYKVPKAILASMETCRNSLWARVISSIYGSNFQDHALSHASPWTSIIREVQVLKNRDVDLVAFCQKRVGNGLQTSFWEEVWIGDMCLRKMFLRVFALENDKSCSVAIKLSLGVELEW